MLELEIKESRTIAIISNAFSHNVSKHFVSGGDADFNLLSKRGGNLSSVIFNKSAPWPKFTFKRWRHVSCDIVSISSVLSVVDFSFDEVEIENDYFFILKTLVYLVCGNILRLFKESVDKVVQLFKCFILFRNEWSLRLEAIPSEGLCGNQYGSDGRDSTQPISNFGIQNEALKEIAFADILKIKQRTHSESGTEQKTYSDGYSVRKRPFELKFQSLFPLWMSVSLSITAIHNCTMASLAGRAA
ncbi:hypothetical protein [uncultured Cohaesibacter sp.]|uniref:hypothetical protein n=1 Tax=uncultured Cohaesibacter sp. TaxID=1002546 RepID=UPI0029C9AFD1|nr:hypothetical protein [uncultured Cohaesibacter sp.]